MNKKLIGFDEELLQKIEEYSNEKGLSFTEAVRQLTLQALDQDNVKQPDENQQEDTLTALTVMVKKYIDRVQKLEKDMSWWNADENESKVGNLKVAMDDMDKKINILTSVSKLFKAHIKDRSKHFEDQ